MCGRFSLAAPRQAIAGLFDLLNVPDLPPRYNVAPTQPVAAVRASVAGRELVQLRWGLVPAWAAERGTGFFNARSETAAAKPAFRGPTRRRRCLVPSDGFFEWRREGGQKRAYHFRLKDGGPLAFAALWDVWEGLDGPVESAAILTTEANELVRPFHDRMPVILDRADFALWATAVRGRPAGRPGVPAPPRHHRLRRLRNRTH